MKVGLIGYGSIGRLLAQAMWDGRAGDATLIAIKDVFEVAPFPQSDDSPIYTTDIEVFLNADLDLVVEAASQAVLRQYAPGVLQRGLDLLAMSVGAFANLAFLTELTDLARRYSCNILLPSGAIGALDALSAAAIDEMQQVTLTTTKPPAALKGVDFLAAQEVDLDALDAPTCVYEGPAEEAVELFPQNVNVAATLSLAGVGVKDTRVRIVADPQATRNTHRVEARGAFGELRLELNLHPSPHNPKTSYLAPLSAIRLLKKLSEPIKIGG